MALTVATNTGALMAQAAASSVNKEMEISMERLSTGKRINGASDDAAGVAIASRLTAEIKGTNQAIRNAMDGQALLDTAEGAHQEIETILQRMRELAVQASNDTNDANDRSNLQLEIDQLTTEIDRISSTTTWAGQSLIDGTGSFDFQVGSKTTASDSISTTINAMSSTGLGIGLGNTTTAATGGAGTTQSTNVITVQSTSSSASVTHGSSTFSAGIQSFSLAGGGGTGPTLSIANNVVTLNMGDADATEEVTLTLNGQDFSATAAADTATGRGDAARTILDAVRAAFTWSGSNVNAAVEPGTENSTASITLSATDLAADLVTQLNNDSSYSGSFTASASSGAITSAANAKAPALTNASSDVSVSGNVVTVGAFSNTGTYSIDVDGTTVSVTRASDDGYVQDAGGTARALIDKANDLGLNVAMTLHDGNATVTFTKGGSVDVTSGAAAQNAINAIDAAIQTVNTQRATLGAVSNRLDSTVSNLTNISSNLQAGRGRIEDADFAAETTNLAKSQILQQASTAMLAQANASKQNVLSLLQG
ncbi:flagellin [Paracoccaceae bacterium]|nr:flagellin [Paracoccaceae bacterium]